jgi:hypothetical protein
MKCPNCTRIVNIGKGWGVSRRFCSRTCASDYALQSVKTVKTDIETQPAKD